MSAARTDAAPNAKARMETLDERIAALEPGFEIYRDVGTKTQQPVVIQLHGCGGKKALQGVWAKVAREAGWAVVVVDSYRHRRINTLEAYATVCTGMRLWGKERAGDLYATMEWVRRQNWADGNRIVAAGWSHGGWTVLDAMSLSPGAEMQEATRLSGLADEPLKGLAGAFLVYPFAGPGSVARIKGLRVDVTPLALAGTHDVIVGGRSLERTLQRMPMPGEAIRVEMLERATHAFDEQGARDLRVRYDPALEAQAHEIYRVYLKAAAGRMGLGAA